MTTTTTEPEVIPDMEIELDVDLEAEVMCELKLFNRDCGNPADYLIRGVCPHCGDQGELMICKWCWAVITAPHVRYGCSNCNKTNIPTDAIFIVRSLR